MVHWLYLIPNSPLQATPTSLTLAPPPLCPVHHWADNYWWLPSQLCTQSIQPVWMQQSVQIDTHTVSGVDASFSHAQPLLSLPENQLIQLVEGASGETGEEGERVWVSMRDRPLLHLYHLPSSSLLTSVDCTQKVNDVLRGTYTPTICREVFKVAIDCRL